MKEPSLCMACGLPIMAEDDRSVCDACSLSSARSGARVEPELPPISLSTPSATFAVRDEPIPHRRRLADYELYEEIASGGMGTVFRARQVSLNRWVALKLIRAAGCATETQVKRFRMEAEAAATLDHPNIVPVYENGEWEGLPFFSMRLIQGTDLSRVIARYTTERDAAARLVTTLARAVHYAHQRGILHRDLKPSNVIIDTRGEPHLTDFGLAKRVTVDADLTLSGVVLGTPSYMAPEQASGRRGEVTTAADIYSLGAILYHLLTGEAPFTAETPSETIRLVLDAEPRRPASMVRQIDADIETICLKCLEKDPRRRYGTAEELAADLERWRRQEPILARPASRWDITAKWCRRRPASAALLAVSFLALLIITVLLTTNRSRLMHERQIALSRAKAAEQARDLAESRNYVATIRAAAARIQGGNAVGVAAMLDGLPINRRGWEWGYLRAKIPKPTWKRIAHSQSINAMLLTSDGECLLTAGEDHLLRCWDLATHAERWHSWHQAPIGALAISRHESQAVGSCRAEGLASWNLDAGQLDCWVRSNRFIALCTTPNADLGFAAIGNEDGCQIVSFDTRSLKFLSRLPLDHQAPALAVCGSLLVVGTDSDELTFCDILSEGVLKPIGKCKLPWSRARAVVLDPDRNRLLVACWRYFAEVQIPEQSLDIAVPDEFPASVRSAVVSGTLRVKKSSFAEHSNAVTGLALDRPRARIITAAEDGQVRVHQADDGRLIQTMFLDGAASALALTPDGGILVGENTGVISEYRIPDSLAPSDLKLTWPHLDTAHTLSFDSRGERLLADGWSEYLGVWHRGSGEVQEVPMLTVGERASLFRPGHDQALVASMDKLQLFDTSRSTWSLVHDQPNAGHPIGLAFDGTGRRFALALRQHGYWGPPFLVYDIEADAQVILRADKRFRAAEAQVALSPDGGTLAAIACSDPELQFWALGTNASNEPLRQAWELPPGAGQAVTFHPNEPVVACSGPMFRIVIWDMKLRTNRVVLSGHTANVRSLSFSPDGNRLASASVDQTVRVWDWRSGQELVALRNKNYYALAVTFSPDGLLVANSDSVPAVWVRFAIPWSVEAVESEIMRSDADRALFQVARNLARTTRLVWEGHGHLSAGRRREALENYRSAWTTRGSFLGEDHPATMLAKDLADTAAN